MPLLNPPDILPEAMRFLVRALVASPGRQLARDELLALVAPTGLVEAMAALGAEVDDPTADDSDLKIGGAAIARASLGALRTLKLVEFEGEAVRLDDRLAAWRTYRNVTPSDFSLVLLRSFLERAATNTPTEGEGVGDLRDALSILYAAPDPFWPFVGFEPSRDESRRSFQREQQRRLGDDRSIWAIPNQEQYRTFTRWAPYLGLARPVGSSGLVPDASRAIQSLLTTPEAREQGIADFVATCARSLPLLDGGSMDRHFDAEESGGSAILSPAMSVTLLQLEAAGVLKLERMSDVGVRTIRTMSSGANDRAVSHVAWIAPKPKGGKR